MCGAVNDDSMFGLIVQNGKIQNQNKRYQKIVSPFGDFAILPWNCGARKKTVAYVKE